MNKKRIRRILIGITFLLIILASSFTYANDSIKVIINDTKMLEQTMEGNISFKDMKSNDWLYKPVNILLNRDTIDGYPDGTFRPNEDISLIEYLNLIIRPTIDGNYTNSRDEHWGMTVYNEAVNRNIIDSSQFKISDFDKAIKREDMAQIISNVSIYKIK